jgi:ankyrin repeat protein
VNLIHMNRYGPIYEGESMLTMAVKNGDIQVVKILLDAGADVNAEDREGLTSLYYACKVLPRDSMEALLEANLNVNINGKRLLLAEFVATDGGQKVDIVRVLLEAGADTTDFGENIAMPTAAECGYTTTVKTLLEAGLDVKSDGCTTALNRAALRGRTEVVELLVDAGVNFYKKYDNLGMGGVNPSEQQMSVALTFAADRGDLRMVKALLESGWRYQRSYTEREVAEICSGERIGGNSEISARGWCRCRRAFRRTHGSEFGSRRRTPGSVKIAARRWRRYEYWTKPDSLPCGLHQGTDVIDVCGTQRRRRHGRGASQSRSKCQHSTIRRQEPVRCRYLKYWFDGSIIKVVLNNLAVTSVGHFLEIIL